MKQKYCNYRGPLSQVLSKYQETDGKTSQKHPSFECVCVCFGENHLHVHCCVGVSLRQREISIFITVSVCVCARVCVRKHHS